MRHNYDKLVFSFLFLIFSSINAYAYEQQGTTVKRVGCNIVITLQIALETDTEADIAMVQNALNDCFGFSCDLLCKDGSSGKCKIIGQVTVLNWKDLSAADKAKFHHITILPGEGTSSVSGGNVNPNSGQSKTGKWYRHEYSPKVYCHETMHLCGLKDRYRDCRPWRIEAGVDNCKDGIRCTPREVLDGACPSCSGFEEDVMGQDVTKPYDCGRNMTEVVKLADAGLLVCSDSCCTVHYHGLGGKPVVPGNFHIGPVIDGGFGYYHMQNEKISTDKLSLYGFNFSVGCNITLPLTDRVNITGQVKLNYSGTSGSQTTTDRSVTDTVTTSAHYKYHIITLSIGGNAEWKLQDLFSLFAGPELGFILSGTNASFGTTTSRFGGVPYVTNYGNKNFNKVNYSKNIQLGINLGVLKQMTMNGREVTPYFNIYLPLSNEFNFSSTKNKLYEFNVGVFVPLK